jgi:hypothetical protein
MRALEPATIILIITRLARELGRARGRGFHFKRPHYF